MNKKISENVKITTETDILSPTVKNHCTIVCGWDETKKLVYMRTFDYINDEKEKELAQAAFEWCLDNCKGGWMMSDIDGINIKSNYETKKADEETN